MNIEYYSLGHIGRREIAFPEDDVRCKNCECCYETSFKRAKCSMLDRLIFDMNARWDDCPIQFDGEIRGTRRENDGN
jgi:hypothetical protein